MHNFFYSYFQKHIQSKISLYVFFLSIISFSFFFSLSAFQTISMSHEREWYYFAVKHMLHIAVCVLCMFALSSANERIIIKISKYMFFGSLIISFAVLPFLEPINDVQRWIRIGSLTIQISEFLKVSFIIYISYLFAQRRFILAYILYIITCLSLLIQPHYSCFFVVSLCFFILAFLCGKFLYYLIRLIPFILIMAPLLKYFLRDYFIDRIKYFFLWQDNYQLYASLRAIYSGSWFGQGFSYGKEKKLVPELYSDFIFSGICEDFGLFFALILILFITIQLMFFMKKSLIAPFSPWYYIPLGGCLLFFVQTILHVYVNIGLVPTTGIGLPLISYGGSSLLSFSILWGAVIAVSDRRY